MDSRFEQCFFLVTAQLLQLAVLHLLAVIVTRVVKIEYIDFIKDGLSDVMNAVNIE